MKKRKMKELKTKEDYAEHRKACSYFTKAIIDAANDSEALEEIRRQVSENAVLLDEYKDRLKQLIRAELSYLNDVLD